MLTDSTRSQGRRQSGLVSTVNQRIAPNGRTVTKDSGITTTQSEKVAENESAIIAPNEKPILNKNTHDQVVVTMPTETNKDNIDATMTNGVH